MHDWRDLEDYVKVKIPKPIEPVPLLVIHQGYDVTSVDRLLDRDGVFATIESPDFREQTGSSEMMTLAADVLCVARGVSQETLAGNNLVLNEPGYYSIRTTNMNMVFDEIKLIEKDILKYFKKA
jgi:hypothetical protein